MILGYKQKFPWKKPTNFKRKISDGTKIHSLRKDTKNRWSVGMIIQQAIYRFRMQYHCFEETECKGIQTVTIEKVDSKQITCDCFIFRETIKREEKIVGFKITIDGKVIDRATITKLSYNDGFDSTDTFFCFFWNGFSGKIIHWTSFKY